MINLAIFWTSIEIFFVNEILALILAFVVADTNNYIWNRWWTFRSKGKVHFQYPQFLLVSVDGLMLNIILYTLITDELFPALGLVEDKASLYQVFAQMICIFLVSIFNFFANALWTFHGDVKRSQQT